MRTWAVATFAVLAATTSARADETPRVVNVYSTSDPVSVERLVDGDWQPLCTTPCAVVQPVGTQIRGNGPFPASDSLTLGPRSATVTVTPGSRAKRTMGWVFMPVGATVLFGAILEASAVGVGRNDEPGGTAVAQREAKVGLTVAALVGAAITAVGIVFLQTTHTTIDTATAPGTIRF